MTSEQRKHVKKAASGMQAADADPARFKNTQGDVRKGAARFWAKRGRVEPDERWRGRNLKRGEAGVA